jgi:AraC-like DNA-binding protein
LNRTGDLPHHRDMMHRTCRPPAPLDRFIDNFWYWEGTPLPHQKELIMASPLVGLLIKLDEDELRHYDGEHFDVLHRSRGIAVSGPSTSHFAIDAVQTKIMGAQFKPGGAHPFFGPSAATLCNEHTALEDIWGADARRLHHRLVEAPSVDARFRLLFDALVRRLCRPLRRHPAVELALARFECASDVTRVGTVAAESGLSRRRFIEVFVEEVGFTPKLYLRLQRFKRVLNHVYGACDVDWSEVAYLHGYADQPHFNREFREFSGLTPSQYLARPGQGPGHAVLAESH